MLIELGSLVIGLIVLVKASEGAIKSSVVAAKMLGVSEAFLGFTLLAFATSLPELAVNVISAINGNAIIGVSNLFGANISDIALVFGAMGLIAAFKITDKEMDGIIEILLLASIIGIFVLIFGFVGTVFGLFLLSMFYLFMNRLVKEGYRVNGVRKKGMPTLIALKNIGKILVFIAVVIISAYVVTTSAASVAHSLGILESFIGATVIALGTTLPEMAVSVAAIRKKNMSLAIGNAVGSLVANLTLILGIAALLSVTLLDAGARLAILFMILTNIVFYILVHDRIFNMAKSIVLLCLYVVFLATMIVVGVL